MDWVDLRRSIVPFIASLTLTGANAVAAQAQPVASEATAVDFAADRIDFDDARDVVTASGNVQMQSASRRLHADRVEWNRKSGAVHAIGNVVVTSPNGDTGYSDSIELDSDLKNGVVSNLLLVLADGGRLAASSGAMVDGVTTLNNAAYSPCPVIDSHGCPRRPSWQINAVHIIHDPKGQKIVFRGAQLEMFGVPLFRLPVLTQSLNGAGKSGFMLADVQYTRTNGLELTLPYYFKLAPNRDLTTTAHIYSQVVPVIEAKYRALTSTGAYQISVYATEGSFIPTSAPGLSARRAFRGYVEASGRFQLDPLWSVSGSLRRATDRTFLRRYDFSRDDRLRSTVQLERIDTNSYFSLTGWSIQTLRSFQPQGQVPIALPEIDYRRRIADPIFGGRFDLQLNSLAIGRTSGQDTQRAFAGLRWDLRGLTSGGQEVLLTAYARGDVYHSSGAALTPTLLYRGVDGYQGRGIGALAAEIRWPLIGPMFGGMQRLTPRIQIVASPPTPNLSIPNEDARSVDLEDSNLFALNRFPGYDRWEDGPRVTVGADWALQAHNVSIDATIGQSYRLNSKATLFPDGTGLSDRVSDIVGRATVKVGDLVRFTQRFRLDKDSLQVRHNEIDAIFGSRDTYATIGYLRLNRNIGPQLEDLRDREELRLGGRVQLSRFISVFGSATIDLTDASEDPASFATGYQPVRHRLGIAYTDDCLDIGLTWRRDYDTTGDATRGSSFLLRLAFRGLGR